MSELLGINPDDTTACPVGEKCAGCGATDDLAVATAEAVEIGAGVFCLTLCPSCTGRPLPTMAAISALTAVCVHCGHLEIDLDTMARLVREVR